MEMVGSEIFWKGIFAPSEERDVNRDTVGAFNADIPLPENDGIIGDKRKAYEQAQAERRQAEKVRSLEDFAFSASRIPLP